MKKIKLTESLLLAATLLLAGCAVAASGDKPGTDDQTLSARVRASFAHDPLLRPDTSIVVSTADGIVHLSGSVGSPDERRRAIALANVVPGVEGVESDLVVK